MSSLQGFDFRLAKPKMIYGGLLPMMQRETRQARGPGRHPLSGRERILAEMLHQRGNEQLMQLRTRADAGIERQSKTRAQEVVMCAAHFFTDLKSV